MNTNTLLLLGIGGLGLYWITRPSLPPLIPPPVYNPSLGQAAGYSAPAGYTSDPGDRNSYIPGLVSGAFGTLNTVLGAALGGSGAYTSSGVGTGGSTYNGADGTAYPGDYSNPTGDGIGDYGSGSGGPTGYGFDYGDA